MDLVLFVIMGEPINNPLWAASLTNVEEAWDHAEESSAVLPSAG